MRCLRLEVALLALAAAAVGSMAAAVTAPSAAVDELPPEISASGLVHLDRDGFRYEYHLPTDHEGIFELRGEHAGEVNVISEHPELAATCRGILTAKFGVGNLSDLRDRYAGTIRRLRALGYL